MDEKEKEDLKIEMPNNIDSSDHIYCDSICCGRVPVPIYNEGLGSFSIYQPNFSEVLKEIYEGLIRVWLKQGKDPFEEFEKIQKKLKEMDKMVKK